MYIKEFLGGKYMKKYFIALYSNMYMDSIKYNEITQVNRASRKAYEQIQIGRASCRERV